MKNILITAGPVHAHLDAVKIITNRFRGGLIAELADQLLLKDAKVSYVCASHLGIKKPFSKPNLLIYEHSGIADYRRIVLELAPKMDAVVLGAAVANLIPLEPFRDKFPSHNFKPGDIIPINFTIAPRIIDEVKKVAPRAHLFGFKLLSNVKHEELIRAAYEVLLASGAGVVFANDTIRLMQKYAVTKERGVHPVMQQELAEWVWQMVNDEYYHTHLVDEQAISENAQSQIRNSMNQFSSKFKAVENGIVFGTIAIRHKSGFLTTGRGKRELDTLVNVLGVDHERREVVVAGLMKASLNAPLLAKIFENSEVDSIVHYHQQESGLPTLLYAPPGTARDTNRRNDISFNIKGHGCMLLFNKDGRRL
ncbi:MAG: hypothetical protein HZB99_03670 [Candidatus Harrisonbacteria bacterium]|nr:hypothetical protein [Candidatus Harrisonbacteria bacterium]